MDALMMWTLVSLSMSLCRTFLSGSSAFIRYLADASYWIYLTHLPIVIFLQIALAELALFWGLKLLVIFVMTVGICLVSYQLFIRHTSLKKIFG
jgi:peptidoglycan/LPS O-acetylase OafA/YrhL